LKIHLRVEVTVIKDDCVCSCKVDAEASCPSAQQEDEVLVSLVEGFDLALPELEFGVSVYPAIAVSS
jgi:hypothetical protein